MNNISLLKEYLIKEDNEPEHGLMDMMSIPSSLLNTGSSMGQEVPAQYRKYISSFPGGQLPEGMSDIQEHQGSKGKPYIDVRDLQHEQKDDMFAPDPNLPTSFGGIVINDSGQVLVRSPKGTGFGNKWTFAKGGADENEEGGDAALREVLEETGMKCDIIQTIPGSYTKKDVSNNKYFLMQVSENTGKFGDETSEIKWVDPSDALHMFADGDDKESAHRDVAVLHMALHEHAKHKDSHSDATDILNDFKSEIKKESMSLADGFANLKELMTTGTWMEDGQFPKEFYTDDVYAVLRDRLKYAYYHPQASDAPSSIGGKSSGFTRDMVQEQLMGLLDQVDEEFGSQVMRKFHNNWAAEYLGSHDHTSNLVLNDIVGEMVGSPETYHAKTKFIADVDVHGQPTWRSGKERDALIKAYEDWQAGGSATGQLPDRYDSEINSMVEGHKYDFGDKSLKSNVTPFEDSKQAQSWQFAAQRAEAAKKSRGNYDSSIEQSLLVLGRTLKAPDGSSMNDKSPEEAVARAREMLHKYVRTQRNISRSVLDAVTDSPTILLHRGVKATGGAREVGGDYNPKASKEMTLADLHKLGMVENPEDETEEGFKIKTHSRPMSGYSVQYGTPETHGGFLLIDEEVSKDRIFALPFHFKGSYNSEKEIGVMQDPATYSRVYYGGSSSYNKGIVRRTDKHFLQKGGWGMGAKAFATETPHGDYTHGVEESNTEGEVAGDVSSDYTPDKQGKLGTQSGGVYTHKDGTQVYVKTGNPHQHAVEDLSNKIYQACGIKVAPTKLVNWEGNTALVSDWMKGAKYHGTPGNLSDTPDELTNSLDLHEGFLTDCLLANWDVAGAGPERPFGNILEKDGEHYRIDHGGAMYFSGTGQQSAAKSDFWNSSAGIVPKEVYSMRLPNFNSTAAHLFQDMPDSSMKASFKALMTGVGNTDNIYKLVQESGVPPEKMEPLMKALVNRRDGIKKFMKDEHPDAYDDVMNNLPIAKAEFKFDPRIVHLAQRSALYLNDINKDS